MLERIVHGIGFCLAALSALALAAMMLHVTADVIGKYVFNAPVPGTAEIVASYYMITVVFLPLAWLEVKNGPIVVELFFDMGSPAMKRALLAFAIILSILFYGVIAWLSWQPAIYAWQIGEIVAGGAWQVTIWPTKFLLPLGLGLACLALVIRLGRVLFGEYRLPAADDHPQSDPA